MIDVRDIIRIGQVSSITPETCSCRVAFDDMLQSNGEPLVSYDLQILQPRTVSRQDFHLPEVGEHVLCVFLGNGYEEGFVIGSFYSSSNLFSYPPQQKDSDLIGEEGIYRTHYIDNSFVEYDLNKNLARLYSENFIRLEMKEELKGGHFTIEADIKAKTSEIKIITHSPSGKKTTDLYVDGQTGKIKLWTKSDIDINTDENVTINAQGNTSINTQGNTNITTSGTTNIISGGNINATASNINLN